MALEDRKLFGETHRDLPNAASDNVTASLRSSRRGELGVQPFGKYAYGLADEGSYFVATNPTPGTGVAGISAADGFDQTEALLHLRNDATAGEGTRIYLDYVILRATAAGTNGTDFAFAVTTDTGTDRHTSGGSSITAVNPNMASSASTSATIDFGALVMAAASSQARLVSHGLLRVVIKVIGDTYLFRFGEDSKQLGAQAVEGTNIANTIVNCPPVVLGPGDFMMLHEFASSQTVAASYEFELGYWER